MDGVSMDATTLNDLERRVAGGDREAFADLYDLIAPRVYGALTRAMDADRAAALMHSLLVEAWQRAPRLRSRGASIAAWLLAEARRRCDAVRAERPSGVAPATGAGGSALPAVA